MLSDEKRRRSQKFVPEAKGRRVVPAPSQIRNIDISILGLTVTPRPQYRDLDARKSELLGAALRAVRVPVTSGDLCPESEA